MTLSSVIGQGLGVNLEQVLLEQLPDRVTGGKN